MEQDLCSEHNDTYTVFALSHRMHAQTHHVRTHLMPKCYDAAR